MRFYIYGEGLLLVDEGEFFFFGDFIVGMLCMFYWVWNKYLFVCS